MGRMGGTDGGTSWRSTGWVENEKRWICIDSDPSLTETLSYTNPAHAHRCKFKRHSLALPFIFFFGYVFSHCSSAVYATAGQINQGELEQNWSEADRGSGQIQSEIEKTMWEYRMNDREAGGNKMRESTGDEEERREWQEEERIPESVREEQHYVIFVWLNLTGNMREGLLHLPFFADNIASSLFFLLLCWWWWFLFIATSFKTWIIAYF